MLVEIYKNFGTVVSSYDFIGFVFIGCWEVFVLGVVCGLIYAYSNIRFDKLEAVQRFRQMSLFS